MCVPHLPQPPHLQGPLSFCSFLRSFVTIILYIILGKALVRLGFLFLGDRGRCRCPVMCLRPRAQRALASPWYFTSLLHSRFNSADTAVPAMTCQDSRTLLASASSCEALCPGPFRRRRGGRRAFCAGGLSARGAVVRCGCLDGKAADTLFSMAPQQDGTTGALPFAVGRLLASHSAQNTWPSL